MPSFPMKLGRLPRIPKPQTKDAELFVLRAFPH